MAFAATHLRFALDVRDILQPADFSAYLSGALYPDSRYVTKVDRAFTHPKDFETDSLFLGSDFRKGWLTHLVVDRHQFVLMHEHFGHLIPTSIDTRNDAWIRMTALKALQDRVDVDEFDIKTYLPYLTHVEPQFGEDPEIIRAYHEKIREYFAFPGMQTIYNIALHLGADEGMKIRLHDAAEELAMDERVMRTLPHIYGELLARGKKEIAGMLVALSTHR
jgi:hypothetical protein